jgi:hypothetical protein
MCLVRLDIPLCCIFKPAQYRAHLIHGPLCVMLLKTMVKTKYIDNYPTCEKTHATFRLYYDKISPDEITKILKVRPTTTQVKGDRALVKIRNRNKLSKNRIINLNGWFIESADKIKSKDTRRHLDYVLKKISKKSKEIRGLIGNGAHADISCYWVSSQGHGGPTLSTKQMEILTTLGIDITFDIYFWR